MRKYYNLLTNEKAPVTYLDEKWFYTTNRRRKIKKLPRSLDEEEGVDVAPPPKVQSRRFPVKAMFMGVVGRPLPEKGFDGRVHLERVSKTEEVKSLTAHQNFSDDVILNCEIKDGGWKKLHTNGICVEDMKDLLQATYDLDDAIIERIKFQYKTKVGEKGNTKVVRISEAGARIEGIIREKDNPNIPGRALTIDDVQIRVHYQQGDTIEIDCNCDSAYMLTAMDQVGQSIRSAYHWIPASKKCFLVMDNAGGHGTDEAIEKYVSMLNKKYNIETIFQVPRTPSTNVLDLGVWCSFQSRVKKTHHSKQCNANSLVRSVEETWNEGNLDQSITSVFNRLQRVLVLLVEANGKSNLVETKRGKMYKNMNLPEHFDLTIDIEEPTLVDEEDSNELF